MMMANTTTLTMHRITEEINPLYIKLLCEFSKNIYMARYEIIKISNLPFLFDVTVCSSKVKVHI